jgi:hypothetical protein
MKIIRRILIGLGAYAVYLLIGLLFVKGTNWFFGGGPQGPEAIPFVLAWPAALIVLTFKSILFVLGLGGMP